jgi:hypothetical protein
VDSKALSPTQGRLKIRLNHKTANHMPVPAPGEMPVCQLHRWAHKEFNPDDVQNNKPTGSRAHVTRCKACGVNLSLGCKKFSTHNNASGSMFPQSLVRRNDIGGCASFGLLIGHVIM